MLRAISTSSTYGGGGASQVTITAAGAGDGGDANYSSSLLYLPFTGANGASIIKDVSPYQRRDVTNSGVTTSTAQSKYNGSSARFDGASYIKYRSEKLVLPTVFTVRGYFRFDAVSGLQVLFDTRNGGSDGFVIISNGDTFQVFSLLTSVAGALSANTWYLGEFCRDASNNIYLFLDGALVASGTSAGTFIASQVVMGKTNESSSNYFTGYAAYWQLLSGVCAHTSAYTPPSAPFLLAGQIDGTIENTSEVTDFRIVATDAATGDYAGDTTTSTSSFTIDCNRATPCIITLSPANEVDYGVVDPVSYGPVTPS